MASSALSALHGAVEAGTGRAGGLASALPRCVGLSDRGWSYPTLAVALVLLPTHSTQRIRERVQTSVPCGRG